MARQGPGGMTNRSTAQGRRVLGSHTSRTGMLSEPAGPTPSQADPGRMRGGDKDAGNAELRAWGLLGHKAARDAV